MLLQAITGKQLLLDAQLHGEVESCLHRTSPTPRAAALQFFFKRTQHLIRSTATKGVNAMSAAIQSMALLMTHE